MTTQASADAHEDFGQTFRRLRHQAKRSQVSVAEAAEVSPGYIGLIETGQRRQPSVKVVKKLAMALGADVPMTEELLRAAGWLRPDEHLVDDRRTTIREAVAADPILDDEAKDLLLAMYDRLMRGRIATGVDQPDRTAPR